MKYTIEQIEYLRSKAAISYEEAKNVLEQADGDLTKALCELERQGKLYSNGRTNEGSNFWDTTKSIFHKGNVRRVQIRRSDDIIANFSLNYIILFVICAPHLAFLSLAISLVLGYKIRFHKELSAKEKIELDFQSFVDKTAANFKETVKSFSEFQESTPYEANTKKEDGKYNEVNIE